MVVIGVGLLAYLVARGEASLIVWIVGLAVIAVLVAFLVGRWERHPANAYWQGLVSFHADDFDDATFFPNVVRTPRRNLGNGLSGGKMLIGPEGVSFKAGGIMTPRLISGSFTVPWERIERVDVSRVPMKASFLGGSVIFDFTGGHDLYGEFLGSRKVLFEALLRTPLAQRP